MLCSGCGQPLEPAAALTLSIRAGELSGGWVAEDLAAFHEDCWEDFQREHDLLEL
jgi:hypothetical protein